MSSSAAAGVLYFDFNANFDTDTNSSVFLFGDAGQMADVTTLSGFSTSVTLNSEGFFNLAIDDSFQQMGTGVRDTGFRVVSPDPIAGYFVNRRGASTDMTYILDESALGTSYVVASQGTNIGEGSQVAIHATQDSTAVTFTPTVGAPVNVVLNAGETYKYAGGAVDLTGSQVQTDKPVAVFSGHSCAQVPTGTTFCDTLIEQMVSNDRLSSEYLLTASDGASLATNGSDLVRVIATADNTQVTVDGVVVATLNAGEVHQFLLPAGDGAEVEASAPVMVAQYLTGGGGNNTDPAMSLVPGSDTWLDSYRLATPSGDQAFDVNYASIVIDTAFLTSLMLDGSAVDTSGFTGIGATGFSRGLVDLPLGLFSLTADDPFLVMLGGGSLADSYFTYGGATFAPGVSPDPDPEPDPDPDPNPTDVPAPAPLNLLLAAIALLGFRLRRRAA